MFLQAFLVFAPNIPSSTSPALNCILNSCCSAFTKALCVLSPYKPSTAKLAPYSLFSHSCISLIISSPEGVGVGVGVGLPSNIAFTVSANS